MPAGVTRKRKLTWLAPEPLPATCPYREVSSENDWPLVFLHQLGLSIESNTAESVPLPHPHPQHRRRPLHGTPSLPLMERSWGMDSGFATLGGKIIAGGAWAWGSVCKH